MADTFSNVTGDTYLTDLGITIRPASVLHGAVWRPHPILAFCPVMEIPRGQTGWGVRTMADFSAALSFAENTALTDQAAPTITSVNPTLVGRGFSLSHSVQGRQRVSDDQWPQYEKVMLQKVLRVMIDDLTHGSTNGITPLSSAFTDITVDSGANASLDGFITAVLAVSKPAVAFYDAVGIQGLIDSIRAEGHLYANQGVTDQVRRSVDAFSPDMIHSDGFVFEIAGCRVYQTNNKTGDASRLYETGGDTHAIIMSDHRRRMEAARGNPMSQYDLVAPPIVVQGRRDPIPDLPRVHDPKVMFALASGGEMPNEIGMDGRVELWSWFDLGNNVAGHKRDYAWVFDPIATSAADIRCHPYSTTYV